MFSNLDAIQSMQPLIDAEITLVIKQIEARIVEMESVVRCWCRMTGRPPEEATVIHLESDSTRYIVCGREQVEAISELIVKVHHNG